MPSRAAHIGLNAHLLSLSSSYRSAGISWYIYHLLQELPAAAPFRYTAFTGEPCWTPPAGMTAARTRWRTNRPAVRILWEQLVQPLVLARQRIDLLHALAYVAPAAWSGPSVVTVLDLSFILFPERFRPLNRLYLSLLTRLSARRADQVIAISENTRQDAIRLLGLATERVKVVYCGVDAAFRPQPAEALAHWRRSKGLPERFILYLGTLEPRKNITGLVAAYDLLRGRSQPSDLPALVLAGAKGWYYDEIYRLVEQKGLQNDVHFAGYVPAEELPLWYSAAEQFVYPSLYEGFGLPVLEAMACGTPVVTSDRASLPEVVGDAGLCVAPEQPEALAEAMARLLGDAELRAELSRRSLERAGRFSWERTAQETATVYSDVLSRKERLA